MAATFLRLAISKTHPTTRANTPPGASRTDIYGLWPVDVRRRARTALVLRQVIERDDRRDAWWGRGEVVLLHFLGGGGGRPTTGAAAVSEGCFFGRESCFLFVQIYHKRRGWKIARISFTEKSVLKSSRTETEASANGYGLMREAGRLR